MAATWFPQRISPRKRKYVGQCLHFYIFAANKYFELCLHTVLVYMYALRPFKRELATPSGYHFTDVNVNQSRWLLLDSEKYDIYSWSTTIWRPNGVHARFLSQKPIMSGIACIFLSPPQNNILSCACTHFKYTYRRFVLLNENVQLLLVIILQVRTWTSHV